jgi:hypothetical protein
MAVIDTRFGGNLERANTGVGIRSLPRSPLAEDTIADRESYGRGQIYNPQKGARDVSGYMEEEDYFNPNVFSRQMAVQGFPNAPREIANQFNFGGPFSSAANLRESLNYMKAVKNNPNLIDPMYRDLYPELFNFNPSMADLYKTKEEQMEDAGPFEAMQMDRYARENPLLNILKGTQTTDVTGPGEYGYENETTEEMVDPGVYAMSPAELSYMYGASTDAPMTSYANQSYPDEQFLPNPYTPPSNRQPGLNNPFMPSDRQPGISDANDPLRFLPSDRQPGIDEFNDRPFTDPNFSLTPENIGMDRGPEELMYPENEDGGFSLWDLLPGGNIGRGILGKIPEAPSDPIMDMAGDTTGGMAGELIRNGIDTRGLNSDEIIQLYNQNFGNPDADVDQFGIADVDDDNAAVQSLFGQGFSMEEIIKIMAERPVRT